MWNARLRLGVNLTETVLADVPADVEKGGAALLALSR
jgi:hypothetical protein